LAQHTTLTAFIGSSCHREEVSLARSCTHGVDGRKGGQGSYVSSPTKFLENESENDGGEKRRQVVTHDIADNLNSQESDSIYRPLLRVFINQTVKKFPNCTRRVHARGLRGHPYYSSVSARRLRRKRQRTRGPTSRYFTLDRAQSQDRH